MIDDAKVAWASGQAQKLKTGLGQVLFGQEALLEAVVVGVLARGHLLLEGLPGLGKTELVKGLGRLTGLSMRRIQFTPDLLPGDITGNPILQETNGERRFVFQQGPVFTSLLLADEINRASPKTQSALLEAMQERRVTVFGETHPLPDPFFVLATQNPIELEGTYPLPEAQLDRFLLKIEVKRNPVEVLQRIVMDRHIGVEPELQQILSPEELREVMGLVSKVHLPEAIANYIARLVNGTHRGETKAAASIKFGASPRAAIALAAAARARALLQGRGHTGFEDVEALIVPVMQHRIILDYGAKLEGETPEGVLQKVKEEIVPHHRGVPDTLQAAKA